MRIWHRDVSLEQLNRLQQGSMPQHVGILLTEIGDDFLRGSMPVNERTRMPFGSIHGGASVVLAETLGSVAANVVVDNMRQSCVGQDINANHIRPAPDGSVVTGTARAIHLGRRSQIWGIDIVDAHGHLVCVARLTMAVLDRPQA
jgi:1,4-dihydroxy-2-naphthoyl-CoA hydrolase